MPITLRPYQQEVKDSVEANWGAGAKGVCAVLPTGAGKTATAAKIVHDFNGPTCIIAHRQELVGQMSTAMAREGVRHKIIGPQTVIRLANQQHREELGRSYYDANSNVVVAGVQTLIRREESLRSWAPSVGLWVTDECHHLSEGTQWHKATQLFPNAVGLGLTATPMRCDGKPINVALDSIVEGPSMRWLIDNKYLTPYRIFCPPNNIHFKKIKISKATGDYSMPSMVQEVKKSRIVGDIVKHYLKIAPGKLGVTFVTDVDTAHDVAAQFNAAGVPAAALSAKNTDVERAAVLKKFRNRQILQLVNVDLFGEGFDLPAIEVCSMARPTQSYGLYVQQFGRALRIMEGKTHAIIIDHVGNCITHGLPDAPKNWSLEGRKRSNRNTEGEIPVRACSSCLMAYLRTLKECPFCGHYEAPSSRSAPEFVDGDLTELDANALASMRGETTAIMRTNADYAEWLKSQGVPEMYRIKHMKTHVINRIAQENLRKSIALWAGERKAKGQSDSESYREFYHKYRVDVLSAQALKHGDANNLKALIDGVGNKGSM